MISCTFVDADRVVCSFSSAAAYRKGEYAFELTDVPVSLCSHVVYDRLAIDTYSNGSLSFVLSYPDVDVADDGWEKFSALKRTNRELKLLISIRSPFLLYTVLKPFQRKEFAEKLVELMEDFTLDGVELFSRGEGMGSEDPLYLMMEELKSSFQAAGHPTWEVILFIQINEQGIDHARLCSLTDFVHVFGARERRPKYSSNSTMPTANALFDIDDQTNMTLSRALQYWLDRGCPANKIVLGVVFIAQVYKIEQPDYVEECDAFCSLTQDLPYCTYMEMCQKLNEGKWTVGWDDTEGMAPHAIQGTNWWLAYENEASVGRKGELARKKGLAGVYCGSLEMDDYRGKCGPAYPLLKALSGSFRRTLAI
uniref:GH18 domain-containing protein n=1 Tax=Anopheles christyi TaxID=43041 RepID=A0A182KD27_9DIPT